MPIIMKSLVLGLFLIFLPMIFAESRCCQAMRENLERIWRAYQIGCNATCPGDALLFEGNSTDDYAITVGAPAMTATTACFWIKTSQIKGQGHYISYATSEHDNEFLIRYETDLSMVVYSGRATSIASVCYSSSHGIKINDGKWHHICGTWKSEGGQYQIYKDGNLAGSGGLGCEGVTLSAGGTWVLGQDQDSVAGEFVASQSMEGVVTDVNIWDKVLIAEEIFSMSHHCGLNIVGNVKSWSDFVAGVRGNVKIVNPSCCSVFNN